MSVARLGALLFVLHLAVSARGDDPPKKQDKSGTPDAAAAPVSEVDRLAFEQSKVAAEMTELENRMFRLGEALQKLEPDNSSRLRNALKYAKDELILLKMTTAREHLDKRSFADALSEQRTTLEKLQRLESLLLARDLDFQMKLERLRKMKEILKQLETAIKEEDHQLHEAKPPAKLQEQLALLRKREEQLRLLVARQTSHVEAGRELASKENSNPPADAANGKGGGAGKGGDSAKSGSPSKSGSGNGGKSGAGSEAQSSLAKAQKETRQQTDQLNAQSKSPNLDQAGGQMGEAVAKLENRKPSGQAVPNQQTALDALKKELGDVEAQAKTLEKQIEQTKFADMKKDEQRNKTLAETIAQNMRQLGQSGAAASESMKQATSSQQNAENSLGGKKAGPASESQSAALEALKKAKDQIQGEMDKLLEELQPEIHAKVLAALNEMLEKQIAIREGTERVGPKAAVKNTAALAALGTYSKDEAKVIGIADSMIALTEETEFSIALPDALRAVRIPMAIVRDQLEQRDGSQPVVDREKQIEQDLRDLMQAMKQMPSSRKPKKPSDSNPQEQEKELNRLIAELRMIRLMQIKVNKETSTTDKKRPPESLPEPVKQLISRVEVLQTKVRDTTAKLSKQREQPPEGGNQ